MTSAATLDLKVFVFRHAFVQVLFFLKVTLLPNVVHHVPMKPLDLVRASLSLHP